MAIDIEFRGIGEDILATIREAGELTAKLRGEVAATNEAQTKGAAQVIAAQERVQATLEGSVIAVQELGKQSATQGKVLVSELDKAGASATKLDGALSQVERTDLQKLVNEAKAVAAAEGTVVKALDAERRARLDQLVQVKALTAEEGKLLGEVIEVTEALKGQSPNIEAGAKSAGTLKGQFLAAKNEATALIVKFGEFSPQAIAATKRAAELKDQLSDFSDRLDALNPDAKFAAFGQVLTSVSGAFTAAAGAAALFGAENEDIQKGILKLQGALAITQGLQAFFGGFADGLKNIRTLLGITTVAQQASTVAIEVDTVAKGVNTGATLTLSGATAGLTAAIRTLSATLAISPLGLAALAIGAIGAALVLLTRDTANAVSELSDLAEAFDVLSKKRLDAANNANRLKDIQDEIDLTKAGGTAAQQRANVEAKAVRETNALTQRRKELEAELGVVFAEQALNAVELNKALRDGDEDAIKLINERLAANSESLKAKRKEIDDSAQAEKEIAKTKELDILNIEKASNKESADNARQRAEERRRIQEQLAADLERIQRNVSDRIKAIELEEADPEQRLAIQREAAEREISDLRTSELRKLAILQLVKEGRIKNIEELTQAEKDAAADAELAKGNIVLDPEQEKQYQILSLATWDAYYKERGKLSRAEADARLLLLADTNEKERAAFELQLTAQAETLKTVGKATTEEVETFKARERARFGAQQEQQSRDIEEQIAIARVEAIKAGGDQSAEAQRAAELQILQIKLEAAQASLAALGDANDQETRKRRADLEKTVAELQGAIKVEASKREPTDIFTLLGIKFDNEEQKQAVSDAVNQVINLVEQSIAAQRAEVDAQISATDELIADRERRGESLQEQLANEIELAKLGLANNIDSVRAQIAENDKAVAAEKVRKAKLIEENKKLARQQLAIDAAQQASALITTGANLLANESLKGIVGVIAAVGFIASVFAAFAALKARASAINSGGGQQFRKGGSSEGLIEGSRHGSQYGESGIAMIDRTSGKEVGEMEGGEYIVNREVSLKHRDIVEAMNRNDITTVYDLARQEIMGTNTIRLSSDRVKEVVNTKTVYETQTNTVQLIENDKLRKDVQELTKEVKAFRREQAVPEDKYVPITPDGYIVFRGNGNKDRYPNKRKD